MTKSDFDAIRPTARPASHSKVRPTNWARGEFSWPTSRVASPDPAEFLLSVSGLVAGYVPRRPILFDVDFTVRPGAILGIVGPNGAGKTCLISTLAGALPSLSGEVRFAEGTSLALVPQSGGLYQVLSVAQNVAFFLRAHGMRPSRTRIDDLLEPFDLGALRDHRVSRLSGGQQKRVSIACGLATGSSILLLDEPTANLDSASRRALIATLRRHVADNPLSGLVISSHDIREIEELCTDVMVFFQGRCVARGAPEDLVREFGRETLRLEVRPGAAEALLPRLQAAADHLAVEYDTFTGTFVSPGAALNFLLSLTPPEAAPITAVVAGRGSLEDALLAVFDAKE